MLKFIYKLIDRLGAREFIYIWFYVSRSAHSNRNSFLHVDIPQAYISMKYHFIRIYRSIIDISSDCNYFHRLMIHIYPGFTYKAQIL